MSGETGASPAWDSAKEEQHRLRRNIILEAAAACLNERGYEGTSLSRIANTLNITNGALYYDFSGKMELAFECLMAGHARTREALVSAENAGETGLDMVERFVVATVLDAARSQPWLLSGHPYFLTADYAKQVHEAGSENVTHLAKMIEAGVEDGSIRPSEPTTTALLVLGSLHTLQSSSPFSVVPIDEEIAEIARNHVRQSLAA